MSLTLAVDLPPESTLTAGLPPCKLPETAQWVLACSVEAAYRGFAGDQVVPSRIQKHAFLARCQAALVFRMQKLHR